MKIYNEVVIDMNPESSSYGETLHEDSFEYEGPMALAIDPGKSFTDPRTGEVYTTKYGAASGNRYGSIMLYAPDGTLIEDRDITKSGIADTNAIAQGMFDEDRGGRKAMKEKYPGITLVPTGNKAGEYTIDPTRAQFQESIERTGGFGELAEGMGFEEGDFEEYYGDPLKFQKQEYGLQREELGLQKEGFEYDRATVTENLRAATTSYQTGRERTGLQTGQSLFDIKQQVEGQQAKSGFAFSGTIAATGRKAQKGVMADYNLQQEELASQMTGARSAFGTGMGRLNIAEAGADITGRRIDLGEDAFTSQFFKTEEDKYYTQAEEIEALIEG